MHTTPFADEAQLLAGLPGIRAAPRDAGTLELVVRRPADSAREVVAEARLDLAEGLVGDNWRTRGSRSTPDGSAHPEMQLNVMGARAAALVALTRDRWALAGDQLFVDLDLSAAHLPPGTRLAIGPEAVIEVTAPPHTGCAKFAARFGPAALKFVNSPEGKLLRLRGLNAKVVRAGTVRPGDAVRRIPSGLALAEEPT